MSSIGKDLATIRTHLGLSLEHIHQATKIPILTLKRVENDSIFSDQEENKTYIRSFVRTYAKALKIDDDTAVKALDQYESGKYSGLFLDVYPALSTPPDSSQETPESTSRTDEDESRDASEQEPAQESQASPNSESQPSTDSESQPSPDSESESKPAHESASVQSPDSEQPSSPGQPPTSGPGSTPEKTDERQETDPADKTGGEDSHQASDKEQPSNSEEQPVTNDLSRESDSKPSEEPTSQVTDSSSRKSEESKTPTPPTVSSVNWAAMGHKFKNIDRHTPGWLIAFLIFLIIAIVVAFLLYQQGILNRFFEPSPQELTQQTENSEAPPAELDFNIPDNTEAETDNQVPVDSFTAEQEMLDDMPVQSIQTLPDTLYITILAAYERLDPVRVWSDLKPSFNPYWMSHRNAYHFEFQDTLRVRGQFSRMQLYLNGHRIDNFVENNFVQSGDYVEITRDMFAGDPRWQSTVPLELPGDTPSPTLVQDRPLF